MSKSVLDKVVLSLLLLATSLNLVESAASCTTLDSSTPSKLVNPCAAVVDYSFYLPNGYTLANLATAANSRLSSTSLKVLTTSCQNALRNAVCASVYLKCQPNIDLTNTATYNFAPYQQDLSVTFPLPMQRPCAKVCTDVADQCTGEKYAILTSLIQSFYFDFWQFSC